MKDKLPYSLDNPLTSSEESVFDMTAPLFQLSENDWVTEMEFSMIPADGTVLYLNQLLLDDQGSVLVKFAPETPVHLIVDSPLITSDQVSVILGDPGGQSSSHYYYEFPNDLKVYSEHSLQLIFFEG